MRLSANLRHLQVFTNMSRNHDIHRCAAKQASAPGSTPVSKMATITPRPSLSGCSYTSGPWWNSMYHNDSKARRSLFIPDLEECQCTDLFLGHRCGEEHVRLSFRHLNGVGGDCQRWYYCSLKPLCSSKLSNRPRATDNAGRCRCVQSLR